jgi:ankyrin repeat protein
LLDEEGAVRDLEDVEGENAFLKASYRGHLDAMKYLAEGEEDGTDINSTDRQGWTALHNAASKGYLEVVMWLAERGATIDARSTQGYTVGVFPLARSFIQSGPF